MKAKDTLWFNTITQNPISVRRAWFWHVASHIYYQMKQDEPTQTHLDYNENHYNKSPQMIQFASYTNLSSCIKKFQQRRDKCIDIQVQNIYVPLNFESMDNLSSSSISWV